MPMRKAETLASQSSVAGQIAKKRKKKKSRLDEIMGQMGVKKKKKKK